MSKTGNWKGTKSKLRRKDYTGQKYNKLTFIKYIETNKNGRSVWLIKCDCGNEFEAMAHDVQQSRIKQCNECYHINKTGESSHRYKHGMRSTRFWKIWTDMKQRCTNPNNSHYDYYGGKGINCNCWNDFIDFKNDMYETYINHSSIYGEDNTTLDRIDFNKDYNKENCRWTTKKIQANNKSNNIIVYDENGNKWTLKEFSQINNIDYKCALSRYRRSEYYGTKRVPHDIIKRQHRANQTDCE